MTLLDRFKKIRTFVLDVDGVLTNGYVLINETGAQLRQMNIKDGYALQLAVKMGYGVVVISGGDSDSVRMRMEKLGVKDVYLNVKNKKEKLTEYISGRGISWEEVLFMGDDMPDYTAMQLVGIPCAPADAAREIKTISRYISPFNGGEGCVREVIEKVLKLNDHWPKETDIPGK
jgi:3-deoxy-D-manno-octulosonate 8-phosphate phosphatase (KDO 8-P phosphatase)